MSIAESTVIRSGNSQIIRLPKAVEMPEGVKRVSIIARGRTRIIVPADRVWDDFFDGPRVSDHFMSDRSQPAPQDRDILQ